MIYAKLLTDVSEFCGYKVYAHILSILQGIPYSEKWPYIFVLVICTESLHLHYDLECVVVINNTKIAFVINLNEVSSERFPLPFWSFMWQCFVLGLFCLEINSCGEIFIPIFYVSIHVDPVDRVVCQQSFLIYAHLIDVQLGQCFSLESFLYYFSFTFHGDSTGYHTFISECSTLL